MPKDNVGGASRWDCHMNSMCDSFNIYDSSSQIMKIPAINVMRVMKPRSLWITLCFFRSNNARRQCSPESQHIGFPTSFQQNKTRPKNESIPLCEKSTWKRKVGVHLDALFVGTNFSIIKLTHPKNHCNSTWNVSSETKKPKVLKELNISNFIYVSIPKNPDTSRKFVGLMVETSPEKKCPKKDRDFPYSHCIHPTKLREVLEVRAITI